jgi:hypothetical protein
VSASAAVSFITMQIVSHPRNFILIILLKNVRKPIQIRCTEGLIGPERQTLRMDVEEYKKTIGLRCTFLVVIHYNLKAVLKMKKLGMYMCACADPILYRKTAKDNNKESEPFSYDLKMQ